MQDISYEGKKNCMYDKKVSMFKELNGQSLYKYEEENWFAL